MREWVDDLPAWVEVRDAPPPDPALNLDAGEREAITLALKLKADLVLLDAAARRGLVELPEALARLRRTSFRVPPSLLKEMSERGQQKDE